MLNNTIKTFLVFTAFSCLIVTSDNVQAEIYKCVNANGETYYNDKTCPIKDKQTTLNNVKDPVGGYIPPAFVESTDDGDSNAVVVGKTSKSDIPKLDKKDISEDENLSSSRGSEGSSGSSDPDVDGNIDYLLETVNSTTTNRTKNDAFGKKTLPIVPLKKEKVTNEPRSKIK